MVVNTQQLQYLVEIHRTGSISHAASNLYMSQPNLSRILRDMENTLGYPIFERTRKGVRPTEKGEQFLHHARNILRETAYMEQLGPRISDPNYYRICIPRSYVYLELVQEFLCQSSLRQSLDAQIRECHPRRAFDMVLDSSADIAILRFREDYQDYFTEQALMHKLAYIPLGKKEYQILLCSHNPLAKNHSISREKLLSLTELIHRDEPSPLQQRAAETRCIYTVDRMAQLQLLLGTPSAYLWSEPLPASFLTRNKLVQIPCAENGPVYCEALIYNPQAPLSALEKSFIEHLCILMPESVQDASDIQKP